MTHRAPSLVAACLLASLPLAVAPVANAKSHMDHAASADVRGVLKMPAGDTVGDVKLMAMGSGAHLSVHVRGLPPGTHGIHIHAVGKCEAPDFASAGPHWNPASHQHGIDNPKGAHAGDLPNLVVKADGTASFDAMLSDLSITGGASPLLDADGAALVIHADPDDLKTDPSGNSGKRIACAVLAAK